MFTRKFLRKWWRRAMRHRILFTALDQEDRDYLYLTIRAFDEIRNADVGTIIVKILAKLKEALKSPFARKMETYGIEKSRIISTIAVKWGHRSAGNWAHDFDFVMYLTSQEVNSPSRWGV